jgi:hypothetical protein
MRISLLFIKYFLFFILLSACADWSRTPSSVGKTRHIVFDIDYTIVSEIKADASSNKKLKRIIEIEGKKYFVHDGVEELIQNLLNRENVKISFFSGGSTSRNHALLSAIKLNDGRTLENVAFKILNKDDLTVVKGIQTDAKFSEKYKKDLTKISHVLDELIMFDDTEHFVLNRKQEDHVVYLGKTFEHFETFKEASLAAGEYVPRTESEWSFARKKLFIVGGAVDSAFKESESSGVSLSEAMKMEAKELNLGSSEWNDYSNKMYKISLGLFKESKLTVTNGGSCIRLFSPFLAE